MDQIFSSVFFFSWSLSIVDPLPPLKWFWLHRCKGVDSVRTCFTRPSPAVIGNGVIGLVDQYYFIDCRVGKINKRTPRFGCRENPSAGLWYPGGRLRRFGKLFTFLTVRRSPLWTSDKVTYKLPVRVSVSAGANNLIPTVALVLRNNYFYIYVNNWWSPGRFSVIIFKRNYNVSYRRTGDGYVLFFFSWIHPYSSVFFLPLGVRPSTELLDKNANLFGRIIILLYKYFLY